MDPVSLFTLSPLRAAYDVVILTSFPLADPPTATTTRYFHHSGPERDIDEDDDVAFDYEYFESLQDYNRSHDARRRRSPVGRPPGRVSFGEPLHDSSDDNSNPRASRSSVLHSPRAAVAGTAAGAAAGAAVGSYTTSRPDARTPRSMPTTAAAAAGAAEPQYATPRDRPPLPSGWTPMFSAGSNRWYYVNKATGRTQWEAPAFEGGPGSARDKRHDNAEKRQETSSSRALAPPPPRSRSPVNSGSADSRRTSSQSQASSQLQNSRRNSGISITGMLLGAAGGIVAGTIAAKALKKDAASESSASAAGSDRSGVRRRDKDKGRRSGNSDRKDDFEEDDVPSYHHSHGHGSRGSDDDD